MAPADPRRGAVVLWHKDTSFRLLRLAFASAASVVVVALLLMAVSPYAPQLAVLQHGAALGNGSAAPCTPALNITWYQNATLAPAPLPPSHADSDGEVIIELFQTLGLSTVWKSVANITIEGDSGEPEGMVRLGDDRYVVSSGEWLERTQRYGSIINGTDRTAGTGFAHLVVYDGRGKRVADATITREGEDEYHNGGIDYDGEFIWGAVGQYRPNTTGYAYKADPATLRARPVVRYADHLGAIVHDTHDDTITCLNWGSRNASTFDLAALDPAARAAPALPPSSVVRNPSYMVDYQDCKWLGRSARYDGRSVMLCSGLATVGGYRLGGVALVDVATMTPLAEVPISLESALGTRMTQNPVDVSVVDGRLRFYWMPDHHNSTLYIYEAQPDSPFQYGGGSR
ncbi:hypothetical protein S40285_03535 [Stachybotrys chlorohalonatus IBT 40285]|uniref:Uncharacterized protein n=1 Tax=Stachybotrys chlorohalonatus (strain IBT 40285) TaxID=1283841 RepID=A0A084QVM4_STAC4|nr:hypothetical protein S40285_03535 [Stachybotrys chlorohalonata IBT 40285]